VNFDFSDELKAFAEGLGRGLAAVCTLADVRQSLVDEQFHRPSWQVLVDMGIPALALPEDDGGAGLGMLPLALAAQEIGHALVPVPSFSSLYAFTHALQLAEGGDVAQWRRRIADGQSIGCVSLAASGDLRYEAGKLSGFSPPVLDGVYADAAVLLARSDDGSPAFVLVSLADHAVRREGLASVDPARPMSRLAFDRVAAVQIGDETAAKRTRDAAAVLLAFEQVGAATRALEVTRDYVMQRQTFGRVVGSYQAIKHRMADMWCAIELAKAHSLYAAWALDSRSPDLPLAARSAHATASEAFRFAARECLQLHGGIGFTFEGDPQLFYRRSRLYASLLDSPAEAHANIAVLLMAGERPAN
jgi:acyl-CoA dehydrogenase